MPTKMVLDSIGYSIDNLDTGLATTLRLINDAGLAGGTGRFYDRTKEARAHNDPTGLTFDNASGASANGSAQPEPRRR